MRELPFLLLAILFGFGFTLGALVGIFWERTHRPRRPVPPPAAPHPPQEVI